MQFRKNVGCVKTNLNSRGIPEWKLAPEYRIALGWSPPIPSPLDGKDGYLVVERGEVPSDWWDNEHAIIERYVDNLLGVFFRVYIVGEAVVVCEGKATTSVRRMQDAFDRFDYLLDRESAWQPGLANLFHSPASEVLQSAILCAERYNLDYGTIDLVVSCDGIPYIVDINTTPYWGDSVDDGPMIQHLVKGLI